MGSEDNKDLASLDDDESYIIESDRFYRRFTPENVHTARAKKAYLKIKNDQGENDINWSCQQVSSILNSFPTWNLQIKSEGKQIIKILLIDPKNQKSFLRFKLFPNFNMNVKASMIFLVLNCQDDKEKVEIDKDERGRGLKKNKTFFLYFFKFLIDLSNISNFAIFNCKNAIFYPPELFTEPFNHFCHYLYFEKKLPNSFENSFLYDFIKIWIKHPDREVNTNFKSIMENCEGELILDVTEDHKLLKKYPLIDHEDQKLRIIGGLYISKDAKIIIEKNKRIISGFLLDSTFRAIPSFVTAIIMASIYNVGVPLAFSFSVTESEEIYQKIFDGFKKKLSIDLSHFIFESDQGKFLLSFFDYNKIKNIVCIRHLFSYLKKIPFGYQISTIIKCRSQVDLDTSFCHFGNEFENFLIQYNELNSNHQEIMMNCKKKYNEMKEVLNQSLEKDGLHFTDQIIIINEKRWNQVSLFARIPLAMPSTTNSLESSHGHINEMVPRRNNFFNAIYKLIKWSNYKVFNFQKLLTKNFNYIITKTKKKVLSKCSNDLQRECDHYKSTMKKCLCGKISLETSLYKTKLKCSHMSHEKINIEYNFHDGKKQKKNIERDEILLNHAARTIKKYSQCKEKLPEIKSFLDEILKPKIHEDVIFIGNFPLSFYSAVLAGILKFSGQIQDIHYDDNDDES